MKKVDKHYLNAILEEISMGMHYLSDGEYSEDLYLWNNDVYFLEKKKGYYHLTEKEQKKFFEGEYDNG